MKKILLSICSIVIFTIVAIAQRYAIVDTKYILDKMPDYKEAQKNWISLASNGRKKSIPNNPGWTGCTKILKQSRFC